MRERGCGAHTKSAKAKAKAKATFHEREPSFDARKGLAHLEALHLHNHSNLHDTNTHQHPPTPLASRSTTISLESRIPAAYILPHSHTHTHHNAGAENLEEYHRALGQTEFVCHSQGTRVLDTGPGLQQTLTCLSRSAEGAAMMTSGGPRLTLRTS